MRFTRFYMRVSTCTLPGVCHSPSNTCNACIDIIIRKKNTLVRELLSWNTVLYRLQVDDTLIVRRSLRLPCSRRLLSSRRSWPTVRKGNLKWSSLQYFSLFSKTYRCNDTWQVISFKYCTGRQQAINRKDKKLEQERLEHLTKIEQLSATSESVQNSDLQVDDELIAEKVAMQSQIAKLQQELANSEERQSKMKVCCSYILGRVRNRANM